MSQALITKLVELAEFQRTVGKPVLGSRIGEAADALEEAARLIGDFPTLIFEAPGQRSVVTGPQTAAYAAELGEWMRRREQWMKRIPS